MHIESGNFSIQPDKPDKRVEPIRPSSSINPDRKPESGKKLPKSPSPRKLIAGTGPDEDELTSRRDTVEISEAAWQALDAYNESRDTESEQSEQ